MTPQEKLTAVLAWFDARKELIPHGRIKLTIFHVLNGVVSKITLRRFYGIEKYALESVTFSSWHDDPVSFHRWDALMNENQLDFVLDNDMKSNTPHQPIIFRYKFEVVV